MKDYATASGDKRIVRSDNQGARIRYEEDKDMGASISFAEHDRLIRHRVPADSELLTELAELLEYLRVRA